MQSPAFALTLLFVLLIAVPGVAADDPNVDSRLRRVTEKFNAEVVRLQTGIEDEFKKAIQSATRHGDQQHRSLVNLQYAQFQRQRKLPPWLDSQTRRAYVAQISKNCSILLSSWEKVIASEHAKNNKASALRMEKMLGDLLLNARGYGLALPRPELLATSKFRLRNSATGTVMDVDSSHGVIVRPASDSRQEQVLQIVTSEDSFAIRNVKIQKCFNIPNSTDTPGTQIILWSFDGAGPNDKWLFREDGRHFAIESKLNGLVLDTGPSGTGGVVQEPDNNKPTQRWVIEIIGSR